MKKSNSLLLATGLPGANVGAMALNGDTPTSDSDTSMSMRMKTMDTHGDGMILRDELVDMTTMMMK